MQSYPLIQACGTNNFEMGNAKADGFQIPNGPYVRYTFGNKYHQHVRETAKCMELSGMKLSKTKLKKLRKELTKLAKDVFKSAAPKIIAKNPHIMRQKEITAELQGSVHMTTIGGARAGTAPIRDEPHITVKLIVPHGTCIKYRSQYNYAYWMHIYTYCANDAKTIPDYNNKSYRGFSTTLDKFLERGMCQEPFQPYRGGKRDDRPYGPVESGCSGWEVARETYRQLPDANTDLFFCKLEMLDFQIFNQSKSHNSPFIAYQLIGNVECDYPPKLKEWYDAFKGKQMLPKDSIPGHVLKLVFYF
ncbi:hypothetical protein BDV96DRAFT_332298 [Lophiotrema nucula]|uniref:Uncharacterized protein n=1 Tax=Lophiotrema nucula TaxID=690887 RepID=A0A6A5YIE5_9PLEO|nr:hypothetical protein BDV96DRAFT_332298 [Lophiotrema nucula]